MSRLEQAKLKKRQHDREVEAVTNSMSIAQERLDNAIEKGNVEALPYKSAVMKRMIKITDEVIENIIEKSKYNKNSLSTTYSVELIKDINKSLDMSTLICDFLLAELAKDPKTMLVMGTQLGRRIIRAYQMSEQIKENKFYYEEMTRFLNENRLGSFDEVYKRFTAGAQVDVDNLKYNKAATEQFGVAMINKILEHPESYLMDVIDWKSDKKSYKLVSLTPEIFDMMANIMDVAIENIHDRIPCVIPPQDWKCVNGKYKGGFYSNFLKEATPIQLGDRNRKIPYIPEPYITALNKLQNTEYAVNHYIYDVVKKIFVENLEIAGLPRAEKLELTDIPENCSEELVKELRSERRKQHVENVKVFSKGIGLYSALKQCEELKNDSIYFVHSLDYRGRLYCMSNGLTTQGADYIKGLLQFKEPKVVGERGLYWLKVRAANTFGYDKASLDDRVSFIDSMINNGTMEAIAKDPIGNWDLWKECKDEKPIQFLATAYELATAYNLKDPAKHMSRLPVGLDGACNGSQHLAVLSNDESLARSVNVLPTETFQDIYQTVVDDVWENMFSFDTHQKLTKKGYLPEHIKITLNWLFTTFDSPPRKLVKRCVMTLPYGSTERGRMDFIREFINKKLKSELPSAAPVLIKNKMVAIIAFMVDESLKKKTGGAILTMKYLQSVAAHEVRENGTFKFITPLNLEVDNFIPIVKKRRVRFMNYQVSVYTRTDRPNISKIKACSAPNYIHSLDACHLTMVINRPEIDHLMAIHDDVGTYPSDTEQLYKTIREEFANLYRDTDYLNELSHDFEFTPIGNIDVDKVLDSEFFFG